MKAWQVSVLVTTALVLSELAVYAVARHWKSVPLRRLTGLIALGGLLTALAVGGVLIWGTEFMDRLASVASAVLGGLGLYLAYQSYRVSRRGTEE